MGEITNGGIIEGGRGVIKRESYGVEGEVRDNREIIQEG
jgi:hypothetical protein